MLHNRESNKEKKHKGGKLKYVKWFLIGLGSFLIYILVGGVVPFIHQKDVSAEYKASYSSDTYYKDTTGVDRAALVETSTEAMDIRLHMINSAKEKILFSTFSMKPDEACRRICAALYAAADRGVQVEILIDGLSGSWDMKYNSMFYTLGTHKNVTIKYYNFFYLYAPWTFNGRLHDKFIVVDDKQLILGGRNTSNYFLGDYNQKVLSYDREVYVYNTADSDLNSVIGEVQQYFESLWNSDVSRVAYDKIPWLKKKGVKRAAEEYKSIYATMQQEKPELWNQNVDYEANTVAVNHISLISNPIHIQSKEPYVWYTMVQLMKEAEEEVLIQSPYLVLNHQMYQDLTEIGSDLEQYEVLTNSIAIGDNICASSDYKYSRPKILNIGIDVYEFQGDHSTHNKSLVIDNRLSLVGSFNFDMRSTYLDTETMLVIDGEEFAAQLETNIRTMQEESLMVLEDETYAPKDQVKPVELQTTKKVILTMLSWILRPFRFLL